MYESHHSAAIIAMIGVHQSDSLTPAIISHTFRHARSSWVPSHKSDVRCVGVISV